MCVHLEGKTNVRTRQTLPEMQSNMNLVQSTIKRFILTGSIKIRYGGDRPCTAVTPANVNKQQGAISRWRSENGAHFTENDTGPERDRIFHSLWKERCYRGHASNPVRTAGHFNKTPLHRRRPKAQKIGCEKRPGVHFDRTMAIFRARSESAGFLC